jgi:hypothetical protein
MKRTSTLWQVLVLSLLAHTASVSAQVPSSAPTLAPGLAPVPAPPQMEKLEEMTEAPITVTPPAGSNAESKTTIEEKRQQGRVTEVKVTSGKSTYYLKPNTPAGSSVPGDVTGSANRGPQWQVLEFDFGNTKKKPQDQEAGDATAPAP